MIQLSQRALEDAIKSEESAIGHAVDMVVRCQVPGLTYAIGSGLFRRATVITALRLVLAELISEEVAAEMQASPTMVPPAPEDVARVLERFYEDGGGRC